MKYVLLIVIALVALFATFTITDQAQPVEVSELAMDLSPPMSAIEIDCLELTFEQLIHIGKLLIVTNMLSDMTLQNANRLYRIETMVGTANTIASIFAVNIGFDHSNQITMENILRISAPIRLL